MTNSIATPRPVAGTMVEVNGRTYAAPKRPTVVIVIDGFDPAYLEHGLANGTLPTMHSFKEHGFVGIADCSKHKADHNVCRAPMPAHVKIRRSVSHEGVN